MRVLEIIPLDKRRSKVRTDADFAFALYKGELKRYHIEEGAELSDQVCSEILALLCRRARERALYLLQSRDRTEQEIQRKLREGFYPEDVVCRTMDFLKDYGYVNDLEYGRRYVETYSRRRSTARIRRDLMQRGLNRQQIEELLCGEPVPEGDQIREFLVKKGYDSQSCTPQQRRRLISCLLRRGYSYEAVGKAMAGPCGGPCDLEKILT